LFLNAKKEIATRSAAISFIKAQELVGDLQEIIKPKNVAAGYARRNIFGFYVNHFFLKFPNAAQSAALGNFLGGKNADML
jgi:hypothetical protein